MPPSQSRLRELADRQEWMNAEPSRQPHHRQASARQSSGVQALKLLPQPQVLVALGFLKTNPRPMTSFLKSISVPFR